MYLYGGHLCTYMGYTISHMYMGYTLSHMYMGYTHEHTLGD